jgi:hypothetical protein
VIMDSPIYLKYQDLYHLDLWEAAKTGDMARLKELLDEGHAIDERQDGATPMYWAQYYLQSEAMEFLLQHGADPNAKELVLLAAAPHQCPWALTPTLLCSVLSDGGVLPAARCCIPHGGLHRLRQTAARCRGATRRALGASPSLLPPATSPHTARPPPLPPPLRHHHWQYTMTPLDYARWRNRTALAALLETEASARGLTNATRSDEPN